MQRLKEIVDKGEIGEVTEIHATTRGWLSQLGTHYVDYVLWVNGGRRGRWVVGHVHGTGKLSDSHPSPDYLMGQVKFENGVRAVIECGSAAPSHMPPEKFWFDNRLTVYGTHGYAWADTDATWATFGKGSRGELITKQGEPWRVQEKRRLQVLYLAELADWLDDTDCVHPCNVELAYHGYEILEGICLSALDNRRVDLPLPRPEESEDLLDRMRRELRSEGAR
jgi:predicted dehydrogenase